MQRTKRKSIKRKLGERILSAFLAMAMVVTLISPVTTQAASKKQKMTFYVGEEYGLRNQSFGWITSVSSSNKKVATIKLDKDDPVKYTIKAKKSGTTTLTISGKNYMNKSKKVQIALSVKKPDITFKAQNLVESTYKLVTIKNKTQTTFDSITYQYTFKNSAGQIVAQDTDTVYRVMAGKTAYRQVLVGDYDDIDYSKSTFKITGYDRSPDWTYKVVNAKQLSVKMVKEKYLYGIDEYYYEAKNKVNQEVSCEVYILCYDANNKLVNVDCAAIDLDKKQSLKTHARIDSLWISQYDHYKMIYQGYYKYSK